MALSKYKETKHDYQLAYRGCYVRLKEPEGNTAPIAIVHAFHNDHDSDGRPPTRVSLKTFKLNEDDDGFTNVEELKVLPIAAVEFKSPRTGYVNTTLGCMEIRAMKPAGSSKYCRILHKDNVRVYTPYPDIVSYLDVEPYTSMYDAGILAWWGEGEVSAVSEAIEGLFNGDYVARAISDRFCLSLHTKYDGVVLLYNNFVAGVLPSADSALELQPWAERFKETLEGFGIKVK